VNHAFDFTHPLCLLRFSLRQVDAHKQSTRRGTALWDQPHLAEAIHAVGGGTLHAMGKEEMMTVRLWEGAEGARNEWLMIG
jgi:hypothetical protein